MKKSNFLRTKYYLINNEIKNRYLKKMTFGIKSLIWWTTNIKWRGIKGELFLTVEEEFASSNIMVNISTSFSNFADTIWSIQ